MAAASPSDEPGFHPTYARVLCMQLQRLGIDPQWLLAGTGLTLAELRGGNRAIAFAHMRKLILAARQLSGLPSLGLEVGTEMPVSAHGQVGYAAVASPDVAHALDMIARYGKLRSNAFEFYLLRHDAHCVLQMRERFDLGDVRITILESVLTILAQFIETLLGYPPEGAAYLFPYPPPAWQSAYSAHLRGRVQFNAPCLEVRLPIVLMDAPCVTFDPLAYASAQRDCEEALAQLAQEQDVLHRVRQRLRAREDIYPGCEEMAAELHMSARTLMRKLKLQGSSYHELLDEVRKEKALWYLAHTGYSVETIAERLGYLDTSNFSRTFRRWFGAPPSAYRQGMEMRGGNAPGSQPTL